MVARVQTLTLRRERIKVDILRLQAEKATSSERYFIHGEPEPLSVRLAREAELAHLELDRQTTKTELLKLKFEAREAREKDLVILLIAAMKRNNLHEELTACVHQANANAEDTGLNIMD